MLVIGFHPDDPKYEHKLCFRLSLKLKIQNHNISMVNSLISKHVQGPQGCESP